MTKLTKDQIRDADNMFCKCENLEQVAGYLSTINFAEKHPEYALYVLKEILSYPVLQSALDAGGDAYPGDGKMTLNQFLDRLKCRTLKTDYTAWLLERNTADGIDYLCYDQTLTFTKDAWKALHFKRREDVDAMGSECLDDVRCVEHMFTPLTQPSTTGAGE